MNRVLWVIAIVSLGIAKIQLNQGGNLGILAVVGAISLVIAILTNKTIREYL